MYQVLYRKWRPKVFTDVVGQPHITSTLINELKSGKVSHAYLFTGSRGTGKTSCAKILSRAVNCLSPVDGNPCNECEICRGIESGSILDVVEIDAASNNGVDNIRDLREETNFTPAKAKYRVYIIDEVHMLSTGAFNALLKTLEEPPEYVIFILATTEVHKLPATILSRCQRFDFRRIAAEDMCARLRFIAEEEGFTLTDDGAALIARIADGAMRDALSLLDQCAQKGKTVTAADVSAAAGLADREYLFSISDAVCRKDCAEALALIDRLHESSCDMERLCTELIGHFRSFMICKTVNKPSGLIICTDEELQQLKSAAAGFTLEQILKSLELLQTTLESMKNGADRRVMMEMTLMRMCSPAVSDDLSSVLSRLSQLESKLAGVKEITITQSSVKSENPQIDTPTVPKTANIPVSAVQSESEVANGESSEAVNHNSFTGDNSPSPPPADRVLDVWQEVLEELRETDKPIAGILANSSAIIRGEDRLIIKSDNPTLSMFLKTDNHVSFIRQALFKLTGKNYRLGVFKNSEAPAEGRKDALEGLINKFEEADIKFTVK